MHPTWKLQYDLMQLQICWQFNPYDGYGHLVLHDGPVKPLLHSGERRKERKIAAL